MIETIPASLSDSIKILINQSSSEGTFKLNAYLIHNYVSKNQEKARDAQEKSFVKQIHPVTSNNDSVNRLQ